MTYIINPFNFGVYVPAPSSRWRFNNNGNDDNSVATLTFGAGVTANATNYHIDNTQTNQYFTTASGTYYNVGSYSLVLFFKWNEASMATNQKIWIIGTGAADTSGTRAAFLNCGPAASFNVTDSSNATTTASISSITTNTTDLWFMAATYDRIGAGTSVQTVYYGNATTGGALTSAQITNGGLQRQTATHAIHSKPTLTGTAGRDVNYYDMRIWDGTVLTQAQLDAIMAAGSEA